MSLRWCTGCGSYHLHGEHTTASPYRPAAPVVQGADEESIDLTPGVVWTDAQLDVIRQLMARSARLLAERDQAVAAVARCREVADNLERLGTPVGIVAATRRDAAHRIRRALDGAQPDWTLSENAMRWSPPVRDVEEKSE